MLAIAATMFSAFIFPPRVSVVFAAEQGTGAYVGNQCGKCEQRESDVQKVDHVLLKKTRSIQRARGSDQMIRAPLLRLHKDHAAAYKDCTKRPRQDPPRSRDRDDHY